MIYMRIDQIMLGQMLSNVDVGNWSNTFEGFTKDGYVQWMTNSHPQVPMDLIDVVFQNKGVKG